MGQLWALNCKNKKQIGKLAYGIQYSSASMCFYKAKARLHAQFGVDLGLKIQNGLIMRIPRGGRKFIGSSEKVSSKIIKTSAYLLHSLIISATPLREPAKTLSFGMASAKWPPRFSSQL